METIKAIFLLIFLAGGIPANGKLNVVTSVMNLHSLAKSIGGDRIQLESLTKGRQDPHFMSAKPSLMLKARKADVLIFNGLDLETGWLPLIIHGSRNPRIQKGRPGLLNAGSFVKALSVPEGKVDRFFGDIHPFGNPHFLLDPVRAVQISKEISQRFADLDPKNKGFYIKNQEDFEKRIRKKTQEWEKRISSAGVKNIVSHHSSFEYFIERFRLNLTGVIEEKPGIPPSAKHILNLIEKMKKTGTGCILVSSFHSAEQAEKIREALPAVHIETTAIEATALKEAENHTLVIEGIVKALENCGKALSEKKEAK